MSSSLGYKMKEGNVDYGDKAKTTPIAMVAPELKQYTNNVGITKTCAVLGCEDSKNLEPEMFFGFPEEPSLRQIWTDLTGRSNWMPTDYSYMCMQHFSVDCFMCNAQDQMVLVDKAEMEVEEAKKPVHPHNVPLDKQIDEEVELLKLFTEVQRMQRSAVGLKDKLKYNMRVHNRQNRFLLRIKEIIGMKRKVLSQKRKKKCRILLSLQDKIKEDATGLVLAMPMRQTDDLKNFALSIYKYSPQAYIYIRNMLRTMLPSTEVLDSWVTSGYQPKNIMTSGNNIKVTAEQTETELSCRVSLG
ncbi:THAP domain-containing protein [Operophtera brumata]|uniref:THAP domain-containing protein n=1 Tax=Operophtera brumata TaxID=104452 RepID=A0A0L7LCR9_OPEBR|nr:THAP domain-containing protein [Operophtera brumata]